MPKFVAIILLLGLTCTTILSGQTIEAKNRYDVSFYFLNVEITDTNTFIKGTCKIGFHVLEQTDTIVLDLGDQLLVSEVQSDNNQLEFLQKDDLLYVFGITFFGDNTYLINVSYGGDAGQDISDPAMYVRDGLTGQVVFTLTEPFGSNNWFPCKEDLKDKADSVFVYITIPQGYMVGSNGVLKKVAPVGNSKNRYEWESRYPTAFYLISLAMANYRDYTIYAAIDGIEKPLPIVNYIYNDDSYFAENKVIIDTTVALIRLFSEVFGVYPFIDEKYGHCVVPGIGGMEHQTMTTLGRFTFGLIAHELAHQWLGDVVTCSSWNDIWINEGFASYAEYIAREKLGGIENAKAWLSEARESAMSIPDGSVHVPESGVTETNRIFDTRTTYKKGAVIIHMIRYELNNDEIFFSVIKEFIQRYKYNSASAEDFRSILEELSGRSFKTFFDEWYYGEGYPIVDLSWTQKNDTLYIYNEQETSAPLKTDFFHLIMECSLTLSSKDTVVRFVIDSPADIAKIPIKEKVLSLIPNPGKDLLCQFGSVINYDSINSSNSSVLIFPNPAYSELTIFSNGIENPVNVTFIDINGKTVKILPEVYTQWSKISISDLKEGIYFIQINNNSVTKTTKFLKKRTS